MNYFEKMMMAASLVGMITAMAKGMNQDGDEDVDTQEMILIIINDLTKWLMASLEDGKVDAQEWGRLTTVIFNTLDQIGVDLDLDVINEESKV